MSVVEARGGRARAPPVALTPPARPATTAGLDNHLRADRELDLVLVECEWYCPVLYCSALLADCLDCSLACALETQKEFEHILHCHSAPQWGVVRWGCRVRGLG